MKNLFLIIFISSSISLYGQIGWVGNMFPSGVSNTANTGSGYNIFIDVWKDGITNPPGQGAGIDCYLHYGSVTAFGGTWSNITTVDMVFHGDSGNNDVYTYNLDVAPGLYEYTCYCDDGNGEVWQGDGNGGVSFTAILPVIYKYFALEFKNENYTLSWETVIEINNDFFRIWISQDGIEWQVYDDIKSKSERQNSYAEELSLPWNNLYVYLEQYDFNGHSSRSNILHDSKGIDSPSHHPNPFNQHIIIQDSSCHSWEILNELGQSTMSGKSHENRIIDTKTLPKGNYVLILHNDKGRHATQVTK